ncbi:MAG: PAS domain S-box protein [Cyclobacteriaceae bacterium]
MSSNSHITALREFPAQATLLEMEMEVMKMIATDQPITDVLDLVAHNFEKNIEGAHCSILLMDKDGVHVRHGAAPSLPDEYNKAIDGLVIGAKHGSCGTAAFNKERVIVSDIATDPLWEDYKELALLHGLKACWSTPILHNSGEVLGTFAIYYKEIRKPEIIDIELIDRSANLVKIAIEKHNRIIELAESEEKYRSLAEGIPDAISRYNKEIRFTYANPTLLQIIGLKKEELIGKTHSELGFDEDQAKFWDESINSVFESGESLRKQFTLPVIDRTLHFDWLLNPEFDRNGNVKSVLGVARDITKIKEVKEEIRKRERFLAVITENIPNSYVSVVDKDLKVVFSGGEAFTKANLDPESYMGRSVADIFRKYDEEKASRVVDAYLKTLRGDPQTFELKLNDRYLLYKTVPLISATHKINSLLVVAEDITKNREAELALTKSERLFSKLTTNVPVGIFQADIAGSCIYVNEELMKYSGLSFEEAMGDGWAHAIHQADQGRVLIEWQKAVANKSEFKSEFRFLTRQGRVTWVTTHAVILFDNAGEPYGYIGMASDVTDQKSIHGLLEENEKRYRTTLERITDGFVAMDTSWRFTYLNKQAGEIFSCNPDDVIGKNMKTLFPEGMGRPFYFAYGTAMRYQKYMYLEEYYSPHDRWYENHIYPSTGGVSIYFRDITERKKDEARLFKAIESLELAEKQAMLGSWEFDYIQKKRTWSKQMFRLFDFRLESEAPSHEEILKRIHPEDRDTFETGINTIFGGETSEYFLIRTNPELLSLRYFLTHWSIEKDKLGNPVKARGTVQDITNRVVAEQKTKESEEKYRTFVDQASDGIFIANRTGFTQVNKMGSKLLGYSEEELLKLGPSDLVVMEKGDPPVRLEDIKEDKTLIRERLLKRKDATTFYAEISATRLKSGDILSIVRDITERKNAERAIAESENRLRTILDNEPECVKILNKRGELIDMNPAGLAMIQADSLQSIKGIDLTELVDEPYKEDFRKITRNVFNGIIGKLEFEIIGLKGRRLWMETHAVPFRDSDGKITSLLGVTRDITERKNAEAKVIHYTNQLRELTGHLQSIREEERAALSRELHDELGQQLTAIKMDLSWLNKKINNKEVTTKIQDTIHITLDAVSSLRRINSELRPSLLDDLGLFPALEFQAKEFSKRYNVPCSLKVDVEEPEFDPKYDIAVFRIFQETLNNIAKHAEATEVKVEVTGDDEQFHLKVTDNGKGFDTSGKGKARSFGIMGMTERAMMMNGTLKVKSVPGKGTTMHLVVPVTSL